MIARIEFPYSTRDKLIEAAKDPIKVGHLQEIFGSAMPEGENLALSYMWPENILIDTEADGPRLVAMGIEYVVKAFKGTMPLKALLPDGAPYNVYVQIPHIGLLAMDEIQVVDNACTDSIQRELDAGWRILCVCPPNAARRPDYIMGRTKGKEQ